LAENFQISI